MSIFSLYILSQILFQVLKDIPVIFKNIYKLIPQLIKVIKNEFKPNPFDKLEKHLSELKKKQRELEMLKLKFIK